MMTSQKKGIAGWLRNIPARHIYVALLIAGLIPLVLPIQIEPKINVNVRNFYNVIEALPSGSRVYWSSAGSAAFHYPDLEAPTQAVLKHLFSRDIVVVFASYAADSPFINALAIETILGGPPGEETNYDVEYGVDYVNLGYIGRGNTALRAFISDPQDTVEEDFYGNSIWEMEIMTQPHVIDKVTDFDLVIIHDSSNAHNQQRMLATYEVPKVAMMTGAITTSALAYVTAEIWQGFIGGAPGGYHYEVLTGQYGIGLVYGNAVSFLYIFIALVFLAGNLSFYLVKRDQKQGGQ